MLEVLGEVITGIVIGIVILFVLQTIFGSGGIAIRGTNKYNKYNRDADARVKEILKNGSGSSKTELQEWWNTYHKK
jgi:hypothetical protein